MKSKLTSMLKPKAAFIKFKTAIPIPCLIQDKGKFMHITFNHADIRKNFLKTADYICNKKTQRVQLEVAQ